MATVRITDELRRTVQYNLRNIYMARTNRICIINEADNPEQVAQIYNFFVGDYVERMQALPDDFFVKTSEITFKSNDGGAQFVVKLTKPKPMPYAVNHPLLKEQLWSYSKDHIAMLNTTTDYRNTVLEPVYTALSKVQEIHQQRETALKQIDMLLCKYSTLSPALKEFPALWDLLPEATRDKHKEVVEKKPKRETASSHAQDVGDLSGLNAAIIASKLGA